MKKKNNGVVTLNLTRADYSVLCIMLGFASGSRDGGDLPQAWKELIDWVMIQGGGHPYWYHADRLPMLKEAQLRDAK